MTERASRGPATSSRPSSGQWGRGTLRRWFVLALTAATVATGAVLAPGAAAAGNGGGNQVPVPLSPAPPVYEPTTDTGSMYNVARIIRADDAWRAGYTGKGVDVAVIDTGVAPVAGLTSGNVVNGPDISFDSQAPQLAYLDAYGHGTHMASIIAGRDAAMTPAGYAGAGPDTFVGIAPDARVVNVKVGAFDGSVDVTQVIAALNWVTEHAHDNGLDIRVISLSFGTDSTQSWSIDPLAYAVEAAWKAGIVVVVAGGNDGIPAAVLANPGCDPYVLAVGADDPQTTVAVADDTVPDFTSRGANDRHVDLVAPAAHVAGLAVPGSVVADAHPAAVVGAGRFVRGSGTSQAAAVTAGAAALLLQRYPNARPDQIKRQLMSSAVPFDSATNIYRGNGVVDVYQAITANLNSSKQSGRFYGSGTGSVDASRGTHVVGNGVADLRGEVDVQGSAWDARSWAAATAKGRTWSGGSWNGRSWTGSGWTGRTWAGRSWAGTIWAGTDWSGRSWVDSSWTGRTWTGNGWVGRSWSGRSWSGRSWSGRIWADAVWS